MFYGFMVVLYQFKEVLGGGLYSFLKAKVGCRDIEVIYHRQVSTSSNTLDFEASWVHFRWLQDLCQKLISE